MAGAGIGTCVMCGRENQPLVSDICQGCHMVEFYAGLERSSLLAGDMVYGLSGGHKMFNARYRVMRDFTGGWHDEVALSEIDEDMDQRGAELRLRRDKLTAL